MDGDEEDILNAANDLQALPASFGDVHIVDKVTGNNFSFQFIPSRNQLDLAARTSFMNILEENMRKMYEQTWGWDAPAKVKEIFVANSKFLCVRDAVSNQLVAWSCLKFEWDDLDEPEHPVLFCYELQVNKEFAGRGIGKQLMDVIVKLSVECHMWKTMLTCFKCNEAALQFYKHIGFDIDCNSPSRHGHNDEVYEILSNKPNLK